MQPRYDDGLACDGSRGGGKKAKILDVFEGIANRYADGLAAGVRSKAESCHLPEW